jgi:hypothetical protein
MTPTAFMPEVSLYHTKRRKEEGPRAHAAEGAWLVRLQQ